MLFLFRINLDTATAEEDNGGWIWKFNFSSQGKRDEEELLYIVMMAVQSGILDER